jgi:hypothetical protein
MAKDSIVTINADFEPVRQSYFDNIAKKMTTEDLVKKKIEYQNKMDNNVSAKGQMRIFNYLSRRFPKLTGNETKSEVRSKMEKTGTLFGQTIIKAFLGEVKAFDKELKNRNVKIDPARFKIPAIRGAGGGFSGPIMNLEIGPQILKVDDTFRGYSAGSLVDKPLYDD